MTPFHLNNKTILVTGASSGIGKQIAISIAAMNAEVVRTARNEDRLLDTYNQLKNIKHKYVIADITNEDDLNILVEKMPMLDGIVHCAGIVQPYPIKFISKEKIKETYSINYDAQVELMSKIARKKKLNKGASIVFLSSISAMHPHRGGALYAGSKAALESFSKVVALEFYTMGIRSNCISAAMVKTPMYDHSEQSASKETMDEHISKYPLGVGLPEDVANAAVFLLSDAARWITGTTVTLDGGFLLGGF